MPASIAGAASGSSISSSLIPGREAEGQRRLAHAAPHAGHARVGVAHDRQQRIQKQRDQRRRRADAAQQRNQEREQRQRRYGLDHADHGEDRLRRGFAPRRDHAQRHRDDDARGERCEHQQQVLARKPPEIRAEQRARANCARARRPRLPPARKVFATSAKLLCSSSAAALRRIICALVYPAFQALQRLPCLRQALRQIEPVQQHRVVARKHAAVVLEHAQAVALDLGVGGIDVHDIDFPGGDGLVGEAVVQPRRRLRASRTRPCSAGQPSARAMNSCDSPSFSAGWRARSDSVRSRQALRPRPRASPARRCC